MTILEPILFFNGALRLTRHGAGQGGNVLVFDKGDSTEQFEIADDAVTAVAQSVGLHDRNNAYSARAGLAHLIVSAAAVFATAKAIYSIEGRAAAVAEEPSRVPNWPFAHN